MTIGCGSVAPLVALVGPTAAGKSALGVWLAERLGGEVLACDSTQVYRHFNIGTGKPARAEQRGVPHHLMDLVEPEEVFTAGDYRRRAEVVLEDLRARGKLPVLTAGTGLYLRALVEGLADAPTRSAELRARLSERADDRGAPYLHRMLRRLDARAAARIAARDTPKMIRAIEVCLLAGKPISEVHRESRSQLEGFHVIRVGLLPPRAALYQRIERRVDTMLAAGWLEEVKELVARGVPATAKPFQSIGYGELRAHLAGELGLEATRQSIQQATRRYAKRQITWFCKEPGVRWLAGFGDDPEIVRDALAYLEGHLAATNAARAPQAGGV